MSDPKVLHEFYHKGLRFRLIDIGDGEPGVEFLNGRWGATYNAHVALIIFSLEILRLSAENKELREALEFEGVDPDE